jgi:hypothetical protein
MLKYFFAKLNEEKKKARKYSSLLICSEREIWTSRPGLWILPNRLTRHRTIPNAGANIKLKLLRKLILVIFISKTFFFLLNILYISKKIC